MCMCETLKNFVQAIWWDKNYKRTQNTVKCINVMFLKYNEQYKFTNLLRKYVKYILWEEFWFRRYCRIFPQKKEAQGPAQRRKKKGSFKMEHGVADS